MFVYFFDKFKEECENATSEELLTRALNMYIEENKLDIYFSLNDIERRAKGKPYIKDVDIEYNISHSDNLWVIAVDRSEVGIDIQKKVKKNYKKIGNRYFMPNELEYVESNGEDGFFEIWTVKEAYTKLLGESIFDNISNISTIEDGKLKKEIEGIFIKELKIKEDFKCFVATMDKEVSPCIRQIK